MSRCVKTFAANLATPRLAVAGSLAQRQAFPAFEPNLKFFTPN